MAIQALIKRVIGERLADQGPFPHRVFVTIHGGFTGNGEVSPMLEWIERSDHPGFFTFDIQYIDNDTETYEFTFSDKNVAFEFKMRFA